MNVFLALLLATAEPVVPLAVGEPAPFAGYLFPPERAIELGAKTERCEYKLKLDQRLFEDTLALRVSSVETAAGIRVAGAEERAQNALERLEEVKLATTREWWDQPGLIFWSGVGVGGVVGAGLIVGSVFLVSELRVGDGVGQ